MPVPIHLTEEQLLVRELRRIVRSHGFQLFGMMPLGESQTFSHLVEWLDEGMEGAMDWMAREDAVEKRADPAAILPGSRSVMTLAFSYAPQNPIPDELLNDPSRGVIARYALYDDYHDVVKKKLIAIGREVSALLAESGVETNMIDADALTWKAYVDTGPFLEREWAQRAGLGFIGRNANLINVTLGSYLFLSEILFTADLPEMKQELRGSCARCTNCVGKCPTGAIVADKTIDARKCISYQTIEQRGSIPEWIRPLMGNRIYGCDICQEVCPWNKNRKVETAGDFVVREDLVAPKFETLLFFDDASFAQRFRKSPIKRAKREGFMRNVAVGLGNWAARVDRDDAAEAVRLLELMKRNESSALVQEHVDWALTQVN
jgi:epoxyqueuosine reductase